MMQYYNNMPVQDTVQDSSDDWLLIFLIVVFAVVGAGVRHFVNKIEDEQRKKMKRAMRDLQDAN